MQPLVSLRVVAATFGLLVMASSVPAVAGSPTTRWVDDDGRAGPTGCGGTRAAAKVVQKAIDASAAGDRVRVCPGVYQGSIAVRRRGLTVEAVHPWQATLKPKPVAPAIAVDAPVSLVTVYADDVTLQGLRLLVPSEGCAFNIDGILISEADGVVIRDNRVIGGASADSLRCGLVDGIEAEASTGLITGNLVQDFYEDGIESDNGANVRVIGNTLRWNHIGATIPAGARSAPAAVPDDFAGEPASAAIDVDLGAMRANANVITSHADAPVPLESAISAQVSSVVVRNNTITGAGRGIVLSEGSHGQVTGNVVTDGSADGMEVDDAGGAPAVGAEYSLVIRANNIHTNGGRGIDVSGTSDHVLLESNDATGNGMEDCVDGSVGPNTWLTNLGLDADPSSICSAP